MDKDGKKIYIVWFIVSVILIIAMLYTINKDVKAEDLSGMPCENPEQFERWYETYDEQATCEETIYSSEGTNEQILLEESESEKEYAEISMSEESSTEMETESESYSETSEVLESEENKQYTIMGEFIDPYIQERLFVALNEANISYWYEIALCQLFQESRGYQYAVSKDGKDHGIFQYRLQYWEGVCSQYGFSDASIYDIDVQIKVYAAQMASRLNQGLSVDEVISRHKTSDEVPAIDWEYVNQVKQWLNRMEVIR